MISNCRTRKRLALHPKTFLLLGALAAVLCGAGNTPAAPNVVLWDTQVPLANVSEAGDRTAWKTVPSDLLTLESDPSKASSDPGYYGREYLFKGDAIVENPSLTAVFSSGVGRVALFAKAMGSSSTRTSAASAGFGIKIGEIVPLRRQLQPTRLSGCEVLRNAEDTVVLRASFANADATAAAIFIFDKTGIVEVKPTEKLRGISVLATVEYGIVPGFIGDDLVFGGAQILAGNDVCIPAEHVFVGLLKGEDSELVLTWPRRQRQTVRQSSGNTTDQSASVADAAAPLGLQRSPGSSGARFIEAIDYENDGESLYLAPLAAAGIWHREALMPAFLEKDVAIQWKRPFPAKWETQLLEAGVKTTFAFHESKGQVWRGVPGSYDYPVWFNGDTAFFHLSKKVPPKGEALIYFLEGRDTPLSISGPADIIKATLGRQLSEGILDLSGRKLRTHHRRGGEGVRRACTCGCTEAIQAVFEAGEETAKKEYIEDALEDMVYFVRTHVGRIDEYQRFADELLKYFQAQRNLSPEVKPYVDSLEQIAQQIPQEYNVQKENLKSLKYAGELVERTLALTGKKDANNLKAYLDLLKAWRDMGGAQDYLVAEYHMLTRKLSQEAGYQCAGQPKAVAVALEVRARCKEVLRNPDGYEIWADY